MNQTLRLLMVEDSANDRELLLRALRGQGYDVESTAATCAAEMRALLQGREWDLITCGHPLRDFDAPAALAMAKELRPDVPFVIVSAEVNLNLAVELIRSGARDYVQKNELNRLGPVVDRELRNAAQSRERSHVSATLQESQELFRAIVENVGDLVAVLDVDGRRLYNSPSYGPLFREEDIRPGSNSFMEIHPDDRERIREVFHRTVATGVGERAEFRFVLKDGSIRHMESDGRAIRSADKAVSKVVVVSRDITELKRLEAELREMAATDILTGLPNRRHFLAQMEQEWARMHRVDGHHASILMLDADHFKQVNDTFGHVIGDRVLRHLATLMRNELRKVDTVGRIGGEEFAFILPGAELAAAELFAERLRTKIAGAPMAEQDGQIPLTVSIGVTGMHADDAAADDALNRADRAMYRAKELGRNQVAVEA